jgi:hypothetical protein
MIEDEIAAHEERLRLAWDELRQGEPDPNARACRWRQAAERWNFYAVNDLIEKHNRWYPVEAKLPMNPRTGDFVLVGGRSYRVEPLDAEWVLRLFPPRGAAGRRRSARSGGRDRARRELPAGCVDVAPAGQPHGGRDAGAVEGGLERGDRVR